jgi:hypothetical protein
MSAMVHLLAIWLTREIAEGKYPTKFALPLAFLISRLRTPLLLAALAGFALETFAQRANAERARDVTPARKKHRNVSMRLRRPRSQ